MPKSIHMESGFDHGCHDCHYSYGRWMEKCPENFVKNGAATCTPVCPEGMVMDYWLQENEDINNFVCLIKATHPQAHGTRLI